MVGNGWVLLEGERHRLIPYGHETIDDSDPFERSCHICGTPPRANHGPSCPLGPGTHARSANCRDCGVAIESFHVVNCVVEQCPRCGGQYISCNCNGSEDQPDDAPDEDE
jgi:hypothetical protein